MSRKNKQDNVNPDEDKPEVTPDETPEETPPVPEQPETDEAKKLAAENATLKEAIATMEEQMRAMVPDESPDPDYYIFKHKRFKADRVTLQNGHVIEFRGYYARIRRTTGKTDYELMTNHRLNGIEWEEVNRIVLGQGVRVATGPMTTASR